MRWFLVACLAGGVMVACAASESDDATTAGSGGAGQGGATTGGAGGGLTIGSGGSTTTTSAGGSTGQGGGFVCPQGAVICDMNTAKVCDGMGGYSTEIPCGNQTCIPNIGCASCNPGSGTCNGNVSTVCDNDGQGTTDYICDPVQGVTCNPNSGLCEGTCATKNLGQSYVGCDYFPTVTNNELVNQNVSNYAVAVANTTNQTANITVTRGNNNVTTDVVAPNSVQVIILPWIAQLSDQQGTKIVSDGAYRLRSDNPITVYQYNPIQYQVNNSFTYTNDASLLLPVNAWTGNYRVVSRNSWRFTSTTNYPGLYAVTASEDNTSVTLTPSATGGNVQAGAGVASNGTGTVTLNAGDVLQVFTNPSGGFPDASDLTGTLVTATKPVQVIGGHTCTNVPHNITACDHLEESMPPLETVATEYFATAAYINSNTTKVRMVRVVATAPNTTITYNPPQSGAPTSLTNAGDYFEIPLNNQDFLVSASQPILVAQYMAGQTAGGGTGDPAMTLSVATAQYRNEYLFHAPTNYSANFVNVVAPTGTTVTLDGNPVSGWQTVGTTGFDVARVQLSNGGNGNHTITSGQPFGISVYGYGQYTSYWYPGGLDLTPLGL
jgi:hypothetical protein